MKKYIYFSLIFFIPFYCSSQTIFRSGVFLHHSTGGNIWGPNGSSTSIPDQIAAYNSSNGYSGINSFSLDQQWWPEYPNTNNNEWELWHRVFDNEVPQANISPILSSNKIVIIKSCFPSSNITDRGQPSDTMTYTIKSIYNYKWHLRSIVNNMAMHPDNFFAIWTNAPLVESETNVSSALLSKEFCNWVKDTLASGLDPEIGEFPINIYIFDFFSKVAGENGMLMSQYAISNSDSHPNSLATEVVAPQFVNEIFDAAIAYEQYDPSTKLLSVNVLIEGLYTGNGTLKRALDETGFQFETGIADLVTIELHNASDYSTIEYVANSVELSVSGNALAVIPSTFNKTYYITVKHRNSLETTSAIPVSFSGQAIYYSFDLPVDVYGGNLLPTSDGRFVIFSGDVNQDGLIDTADFSPIDNDASNFATGYLQTDVTCDGIIDTGDMTIVDNNAGSFISAETP